MYATSVSPRESKGGKTEEKQRERGHDRQNEAAALHAGKLASGSPRVRIRFERMHQLGSPAQSLPLHWRGHVRLEHAAHGCGGSSAAVCAVIEAQRANIRKLQRGLCVGGLRLARGVHQGPASTAKVHVGSEDRTRRGTIQKKKTEAVRPPCAASQPGECPGGASLSAALLTPARRPPPQTWAWPRHPLPSSAPTALCRRADLHAHGADVSAR